MTANGSSVMPLSSITHGEDLRSRFETGINVGVTPLLGMSYDVNIFGTLIKQNTVKAGEAQYSM